MTIAPEQPIIILRIIAEQMWNLTKVQRSGILFLFKSLLRQVFPILRKNGWSL